ncbi:hypothetical protein Peur_038874 [Populus x canadensis]
MDHGFSWRLRCLNLILNLHIQGKSRAFFRQNSSYIWAAPLITTGSDDPSLLVRHPIPLVYPPPLPTGPFPFRKDVNRRSPLFFM